MDTALVIFYAVGLLGITKPVQYRLYSKAPKSAKDIAANCEPRFRKGKIVGYSVNVYLQNLLESEYSLNDVICHELIHMAQFEHKVFSNKKHHNKKFIKLCEYLENNMREHFNIKLGALYNPDTDTD